MSRFKFKNTGRTGTTTEGSNTSGEIIVDVGQSTILVPTGNTELVTKKAKIFTSAQDSLYCLKGDTVSSSGLAYNSDSAELALDGVHKNVTSAKVVGLQNDTLFDCTYAVSGAVTVRIPSFTVDAYGRITSLNEHRLTLTCDGTHK